MNVYDAVPVYDSRWEKGVHSVRLMNAESATRTQSQPTSPASHGLLNPRIPSPFIITT